MGVRLLRYLGLASIAASAIGVLALATTSLFDNSDPYEQPYYILVDPVVLVVPASLGVVLLMAAKLLSPRSR